MVTPVRLGPEGRRARMQSGRTAVLVLITTQETYDSVPDLFGLAQPLFNRCVHLRSRHEMRLDARKPFHLGSKIWVLNEIVERDLEEFRAIGGNIWGSEIGTCQIEHRIDHDEELFMLFWNDLHCPGHV